MAEYFGPWLPSAYFGGGYFQQSTGDGGEVAGTVTITGGATVTAVGAVQGAAGGSSGLYFGWTVAPRPEPIMPRLRVARALPVSAVLSGGSVVTARAGRRVSARGAVSGGSSLRAHAGIHRQWVEADNAFWALAA